ncbi:MAG: error-prone DNA polymerase [Gammaproteobacteria bacterium]
MRPSPPLPYAELHALSNFSFLRGASHPEELVERAAAAGYAALALTDECSVAGVVRAHLAARESGLKLIVGSELRLADGPRLVLLATDRRGYAALCALITHGRRAAPKGTYRLARADVERVDPERCLALLLPDEEPTVESARWVAGLFPDRAWLAVELHHGPDDAARLAMLTELGRMCGLPLVAAGDVHMHRRARRPLQDVLTAIRLNRPVAQCGFALFPNGERHLRRREALAQIYPAPLLEESVRIAGLCRFSLDELRYEYPDELVPPGTTPAAHLRRLTEAGLRRRWPQGESPRVRRLIEHELTLIAELAYEPYFLTVHDIVRFARERGILCQGRGSAANSAVCYALGITEVDPSRMEMLFERFISRERDEPPDIDVDFEHERREEVIQYLYARYGRERAALAATVITYRPRSAVRDVGKALGLDSAQIERLARALKGWVGRKEIAERLAEAGFDPGNPVIARLLWLVEQLLGFPRHLSQHVGGFVISRGPLHELVPVENAAMPERTVIQWDKDDLDALGLLKVDVLGLGMLTAIRKALDLINGYREKAGAMDPLRLTHPAGTLSDTKKPEVGWVKAQGAGPNMTKKKMGPPRLTHPTGARGNDAVYPLTLANIPPEDPAVYDLICAGDTVGVFQIESRAQMAMLPRLKPRRFYDLVIEVAIVRPGPIQGDMVHPYLRRRQGLEPVTYPSEAVRGVLERTLGVPIFQEQVIKLAMVAAGFSAGEADALRRAMAAWRRRGGLEPFEQRLIDGMRRRGYPEAFARQIYQQICGFGEYGFPESHAASFALLVYASAWLKRHHPAAFCAALLNSQPMGFYAPAQLVQDARRHGVEVRGVDVRHSDWDCTLEFGKPSPAPKGISPPPALRLGLRLVKGLSREGAGRLVAARRARPFRDVADLARRARLDRRDRNALAAAGALAGLAGNRHQARWQTLSIEAETPLGVERHIAEATPMLPPPTEGEAIAADYRTLGLTLERHPLALLRDALQQRRLITAEQLHALPHGVPARVAGLVITRQRPGTASGVVFVTLEDETGVINVVVWGKLAERQRRVLLESRLMVVQGEVQSQDGVTHLIARRLENYTPWLGDLTTPSRDFH